MKKLTILLVVVMTVLCGTVYAEAPITVEINGKSVAFDQPPVIEDGRTLVPLRAIFEALDAEILWDADTMSVSAVRNAKNISLTIDKEEAYINGEPYYLDVPAKIVNGRTLVPVRFIAESLNCDVEWDGETKTVKVLCDTTRFSLPREICVAEDKTITIYNKYIMDYVSPNFSFVWTCEIGEQCEDGFSVTGTKDSVGEYPLSVEVKDEKGKVLYADKSIIKVVKNTVADINIMPIGDSLSNNKPWLSGVRTLSNDKITFVGTRGKAPLNQEGRSGFTSANYLNGAAYTFENEGIHPFWDGERFNWKFYKESSGVSPDAVQIFLGTNGLVKDPTKNAENIKTIVQLIRQDDDSIPIFVVNTMYRGNEYSSIKTLTIDEAKTKQQHKMIFDLTEYLTSILDGMENVHIIPAAYLFNSEANHTPKDAVHPETKSGYTQLSDVIYSVYCAYLD